MCVSAGGREVGEEVKSQRINSLATRDHRTPTHELLDLENPLAELAELVDRDLGLGEPAVVEHPALLAGVVADLSEEVQHLIRQLVRIVELVFELIEALPPHVTLTRHAVELSANLIVRLAVGVDLLPGRAKLGIERLLVAIDGVLQRSELVLGGTQFGGDPLLVGLKARSVPDEGRGTVEVATEPLPDQLEELLLLGRDGGGLGGRVAAGQAGGGLALLRDVLAAVLGRLDEGHDERHLGVRVIELVDLPDEDTHEGCHLGVDALLVLLGGGVDHLVEIERHLLVLLVFVLQL